MKKKKSRDPGKDYAWFMRQPGNIARYAGQVVLLRHHTVLGSGADHRQAFEDARRRAEAENRELPQDDLIYFPVAEPGLFDRDTFGAIPRVVEET
ncbi:MAG TPA: hypothetical protein VKA46_01415 [Gemmataceae bacterium]|nr:hypothetical protein [Gemmataceae bacterium]